MTTSPEPDGVYGAWSWRGITAYLIGLACVVPFVDLSFFPGFAVSSLDGVDLSWIVGIAVSAFVYYVFTRSLDLSKDNAAIEESNAELAALGLADAGSTAAPASEF
jgi:NCS1 family nucleobase:cation symporter-1